MFAASSFAHAFARSDFKAALDMHDFHPDLIIIDLAMGRSEGLQIAANLRADPVWDGIGLVAVANEDEANPNELTQHGFNDAFKKPFDVALLAELIRTRKDGAA